MTDETLAITVNGEHRRIPAPASVADLIAELGMTSGKIAVERNLEIVPRSTFAEVMIESGDAFEIVTFVGGG